MTRYSLYLMSAGTISVMAISTAFAQDLQTIGLSLPDDDTPFILSADEISYDITGEIATASGDAEAFYGERALGADRLEYDTSSGVVRAVGNVALRNDDDTYLFADEAELAVGFETGQIIQPRLLMDNGTRLSAAKGERIDDRYTALSKAVYSPCNVCTDDPVPLWQVRAEQVVHDELTRDIIYKNAVLDIEGLSIAYLPYFRHPDPTVKRRTGFLAPEVLNDNVLGLGIKTPYYIELAPNRDITLTPFITSDEGIVGEAEYRARTNSGSYRIEVFGTRDTSFEKEWRGAANGEGLFDLGQDRFAGYELNIASDDTFLRRYQYSTADRVSNRLFLGRQTDTLFAEANAYYFQSFLEDEPDGEIPNALPELRYAHRILEDQNWGIFTAKGGAVRLNRESGQDQSRLSGGIEWEKAHLFDNGIKLTPFADFAFDAFLIEDSQTFDNGFQSRMTAAAGVDFRYPLISETPEGIHILEPVVQLIAANNVNDVFDIPNEDSIDVEFDETSLFSTSSRFPGEDRFEGGSRVNAGIRYAYESEGLQLDATYGRVFRFDDNEEFYPLSGLHDELSDHVGAIRVDLPPYFDLTQRFRVDDEDLKVRRLEMSLGFDFGPVSADMDYVYLAADPDAGFPDDRQEISGEFIVQTTDNVTFYSSARHDLEESRFVDADAGIRYENECCSIDFNVERRFNDDRDAESTTNFGLNVKLKTLGG